MLKNSNIIIWTEGGPKIGMGHVCRSLVIAKELKGQSSDILFCINDDPAVLTRINGDGFEYAVAPINEIGVTIILEKSPKTIILDTKRPVTELLNKIKQRQDVAPKIVLMDNATPACLEADIVIYPTPIYRFNSGLEPIRGKVFGGVDYVPIAEPYLKAREKSKCLTLEPPYQVLVTMGGSDPNRLTYMVVKALLEISLPVEIKAVLGPAFSSDGRLSAIEKQRPRHLEFFKNQKDLSSLMADSHVAITAMGTTLHELAAVGVPAVIISNYEEDNYDMASYRKAGWHLPLGYHETIQPGTIQNEVKNLLVDRNRWQGMRNTGWKMIDGKGASRVSHLLGHFKIKRESDEL